MPKRARTSKAQDAPTKPRRAKAAGAAAVNVEPGISRAERRRAMAEASAGEGRPDAAKPSRRAAKGEGAQSRRGTKRREGREEAAPTRKERSAGHGGNGKASARHVSDVELGIRRTKPKKHKGLPLADMSDDLFLEEWDVKPKKRKKKRKKLNRRARQINAALAAGIAVFALLGGLLGWRYHSFLNMKAVVEAQTFYEGTTVEGVDVSNMTLVAALDYWRQSVEPGYAGRTVNVANRATVTAAEMGYQSDYESVLSNAWSAGRRGSLEQRYHQAMHRQANPVAYGVTRSMYSDPVVADYVAAVANKVDIAAVDAGIESFDAQNYKFVFRESKTGSKLDEDGLRRDIEAALDAGGGSADLVMNTTQPQVTTEQVTSRYGMIAWAVTNATASTVNRMNNIKLAVSMLNGVCIHPGETFSFNQTVGERTRDRGFKRATAYSSGEVTEEVGGGICQVSTTLFNAAVKSDMEIVERHNHSLTVSYVDRGKDAAVNWDTQDMKFKNTSPDDVYICCVVTDDFRVRFALFGRLLENGETITLEGVTTGTIKFQTKTEKSPFLPPGEEEVIQPGKNGYTAEAYKVRWDAAGNELSRELLCKSTYSARAQLVQVGQ